MARHHDARGRFISRVMIAVTIFLISLAPNLHAASTPVLMILEHTEAGKRVETKIEAKGGLVPSPQKGKPQTRWIIRAGDAIKSEAQPGDRLISFYKNPGNENILLFRVKLHYSQNSEGRWVPRFQLIEEPEVIREGQRWKPITTIQGIPNLIVQTGTALPNAEGYSTSLELGFSTGSTSIDAWIVQ